MPRPALCVIVQRRQASSFANQTIADYQVLHVADEQAALGQSSAECFLWYTGDRPLHDHAFEECIWALRDAEWVTWADTGQAPPPSLRQCAGPLGVTRQTLETPETQRTGHVRRLPWRCRLDIAAPAAGATPGPTPHALYPPGGEPEPSTVDDGRGRGPAAAFFRVLQHLENAELLSLRAWVEHPARSVSRLIPLRLKEHVNRWAGRPVFDLSFYLRFKPQSVLIDGSLVEHVRYRPPDRTGSRRRIALCTPHLGIGGAETVLLEFARQIDRDCNEIFLLATHSGDTRLLEEWRTAVDHIYDLGQLLPTEQTVSAIYSMAINWSWDDLVIQNTLPAYSCLPALKQDRPSLRVIDILHNIDEEWDFFSATLNVADAVDRRVVIGEAGRRWLIEMEIPEDRIRLIRNGVDLDRWNPGRPRRRDLRKRIGVSPQTKLILFAGRLIPRKRPLLLVEVDRRLQAAQTATPYHFVIAGDGPDERPLRAKIRSAQLDARFSVLGHVPDIAPLLAEADLLIVPSLEEGLPLVIIEALAMQVPVVSCRVGAIDEAVLPECGVLVDNDGLEAPGLARALGELLADGDRRRAMGLAGRALAERDYDLERARRQYRDLLAEGSAPPA